MKPGHLLTLLFIIIPIFGFTKTIYVKANNISILKDGKTWLTAYTDLNLALSEATSGDEVWVSFGRYLPSLESDRSASFILNEGVKIYGSFMGTELSITDRLITSEKTILDGNIGDTSVNLDNSFNILKAINPDQNNLIEGFTIANGNASIGKTSGDITPAFNGGAIYMRSDASHTFHLKIVHCNFKSNFARTQGGAIFGLINNLSSGLEIDHCTFDHNAGDLKNAGIEMFFQSGGASGYTRITNSQFSRTNVIIGCFKLDLNNCEFKDCGVRLGVDDSATCTSNKIERGLFYFAGMSLFIDKLQFFDNSTFIVGANQSKINSSLFYHNQGLWMDITGNSIIQNSIFFENRQAGLVFTGDYKYNLVNNSFINNSNVDILNFYNQKAFINVRGVRNQMDIFNCLFYVKDDKTNFTFNLNREPGLSNQYRLKNNLFYHTDGIKLRDKLKAYSDIGTGRIFINLNLPPGSDLSNFRDTIVSNYFIADSTNKFIDADLNIPELPSSFDGLNLDLNTNSCEQLDHGNDSIVHALKINFDFGTFLSEGKPRIIGPHVDIGAFESENSFGLEEVKVQDNSCNGFKDGSISIKVVNANTTFQVSKNDSIINNLNNLFAGDYKIRYQGNNCRDSLVIFIKQPDALIVNQNISNSCDSARGAKIDFIIKGGIAPYILNIDNKISPLNFSVNQAGIYHYKLVDKNKCAVADSFETKVYPPIRFEKSVIHTSNFITKDGEIRISSLTGGLPPYKITWSDGDTTLLKQHLDTGVYRAQIRDASGCESIILIKVDTKFRAGFDAILRPTKIIADNNSTLTITTGAPRLVSIKVIDAAGRLINKKSFKLIAGTYDTRIPVPEIPGIYVITLSNDQGYQKSWKVLKV
ncbi:MAG: T9SS type A sorting domain-containing protein [Saprospiraceae bacterium]